MLKGFALFFKQYRITRVVSLLLLVLLTVSLTGCAGVEPKSQGEEAAKAEQAASHCWTCSLFELAFDAAEGASEQITSSIATSSISLLAVCYGLWLAIFILKFISSVKELETSDFWKGLAIQTFWVTLCAAMLRDLANGSSSSIINMIINPIFASFVDVGLMIINASGLDIPCSPGGSSESGLLCLVAALQEKLNLTIGFALLGVYLPVTVYIILISLGIWCVSCYMMLYLPVLLLDCVFRYGILLCLTPLILVAYAFKSTRSIGNKAMAILMELGFAIVGMCVFVAVTVEVVNMYIFRFIPFVRAPGSFVGNPVGLYEKMMGPGITGLIFVMLFLIYFGQVILELMGMFSGGVGGIGQTAAATYSATKGIAKNAGKLAKFGINRKMRKNDQKSKQEKEALDKKKAANGGKLSDKEELRLGDLNNRLQNRGYLAKDSKGQLQETQAYKNLGDNRIRTWASGIAEDWHSSRSQQNENRRDAGEAEMKKKEKEEEGQGE